MEDSSKRNELDVCIEDIRSCWKVPAIAHFCSLFRGTFLLPDFEIEELEEALFLDAGVEQSDFLTNLVVQLLRGIHGRKAITCDDYLKWLRSVMKERWELTEKRVNPLNSQDVTFKMLPTLTKVEILHALCDYRLDAADVSVLKDYDGDNLRVEPLGTDRTGATYWYFYGTRLYKEDRQLTQEEKEAKHKLKLKEKRRRKKERLKTVKKMKEARKKQKQKEKGKKGRNKAACKEKKKKKKCSKTSDEEGHNELVNIQGLQASSNTSNKNTKKELKKKNAKSLIKSTSSSKMQKLKDSSNKKKMDSSEVINPSKKKNEEKSKRTSSKKQVEKKSTNGKKRQTVASTDNRKAKTALSKKKRIEENSGTTATKNQNKMSKSATTSFTKCGNKVSKGQQHDEGRCKSRKRKVIKSKAIISESDEDSDDDQPLKKLAKNLMSQKGSSKATSNKQKSDKPRTDSRLQSNKTQNKRTNVSRSKANNKTDENQLDAKKGKNQRKSEDMSKWSSEEDISSAVSIPDSSDTDSDSEDDMEPPRWHLVCDSQDDWQRLTDLFKKSKVKCEKELYKTLANDFLPEIHSLFAAKEKALRKKLQELAPRRASSRVVIMQLKREEEERLKSIEEAEQSSKRQQVEEEKREKMKLHNKQPTKKEQSNDTEPSKATQSPVIKNQEGSRKIKKMKAKSESIHASLQQVYDAVSNHEDSWPFRDPVDEAYAPAYYQIIIRPMCLSIIQKKLTKKDYRTKDEFERDMNQLFTNCLEYNGPGNEYTLMAENLKSCLEYNMEQVFPKQEVDKNDNDSDSNSSVSDHYVHERPPQRQSARNANTRLEKLEDKVYARLRGLSSNESSIIESHDSSRVDSDDDNDTEVDQSDNDEPSCCEQDELGHCKGLREEDKHQDTNLKVITGGFNPHPSPRSTSAQDIASDTSSSKSSSTEVSPNDEQTDAQTCDMVDDKSVVHSPSMNDDQNVTCASRPKGVIAFAQGSSLHEPSLQTHENTYQQECDQSNKDNKQFVQSNKDSVTGQSIELGRREEPHGHNVMTSAQGTYGSRVNRVKPVQNVRPYIPDIHSKEEDDTSLCAPCDQHELTQQASQGFPAMIDLNSRRPDVLKPLMSSSSDINATSYNQNSLAVNLDLNKAVPQGNIYTTSSLDQDFQHSKQSEHSGTKSKQQQRKSKSKNLPELPAPLTVLPVQQSAKQQVPSVQPLLPSSNSLQDSHWHQETSTNMRGDTCQQPGRVLPASSKGSGDISLCEPTQKLWHPLGSEDRITSNYAKSSPSLYPHGVHSPEQFHPEHTQVSQTSTDEMSQASSQSGNILQSLLHKHSNVSESQQPNSVCNNLYHSSESAKMHTANDKQSNRITQDDNFSSKSGGHLKLPSNESIGYREAPRQYQSDKEQQHYKSRGYNYENKMLTHTQMDIKTSMPSVSSHSQQESVKLHHEPVEATVSKSVQSVARHPGNAIQDMETFVAKQEKLASVSHYPQASPFQTHVVNQLEYGKDSRRTDNARGMDTVMPVRNSGSYLSMLATDSRDMKEYKDRLGVQGFTRPQTAYSQAHSSLYTDQLRMHASQASAASYGYSSGSNLTHLLPSRQTPVGQSSSAFTPHDPYSSQSAFRTQRPNPAMYPQYMSPQEAEQLTRQQYQQHVHHRSGIGSGLVSYHAQPTHAHPDIAYYTQRGISSALLGSQGVGGVRPPMPYDPSLLSHPSHMQGYK